MTTPMILHQPARVTISNQWRAEARLYDLSLSSIDVGMHSMVYREDYFGEGKSVHLLLDLPIVSNGHINRFSVHLNGLIKQTRVETSTGRIRLMIDIFPDARIRKMLRLFIKQEYPTQVVVN